MEHEASEEGGTGRSTVEGCIRAGMYWFGRSDLSAAQAWWRRALELEPDNARARQCLKLLRRSSSVGFKRGALGRSPDESTGDPVIETNVPTLLGSPNTGPSGGDGQDAEPFPFAIGDALGELPADNPWLEPKEPAGVFLEDPTVPNAAPMFESAHEEALDVSVPVPMLDVLPKSRSPSVDPLDFATEGTGESPECEALLAPGDLVDTSTPWDEGPSTGAVRNLSADIVPSVHVVSEAAAPLFALSSDEQTTEHEFLVDPNEGDLDFPQIDPADILIDDPVEGEVFDPEELELEEEETPELLFREAQDRFQLHDFDGALDLIERIPEDSSVAKAAESLSRDAQANLLKMYASKIGDFSAVPKVLISTEEIIWLNLNHRAGFILSQIDGFVCYDDLVALSGMSRLDTLRIMAQLIEQKVIGTS